jgi:hypothetical protein
MQVYLISSIKGNTLLEMGKLQDALVHFKNAFKLD